MCRVLRMFVFVFRVAPILWKRDAHAVEQKRQSVVIAGRADSMEIQCAGFLAGVRAGEVHRSPMCIYPAAFTRLKVDTLEQIPFSVVSHLVRMC